MTYDEQKALRPIVAAHIPAIAAELSKLTAEQWRAVRRPNDLDGEWYDLDNDAGHSLYVSLPWANGRAHIHIGPSWPRYKDGGKPYIRDDEKVDGINLGIAKTDAQIAKDIGRRLLVPYRVAYATLAERIAEHDASQDKALADATALAKAIGDVVHRDRHNPDLRQDNYTIYTRRTGCYTATVSSSGVKLDLREVPVNLAISILEILPRD